ncbi:MAG TPA: DNA replication/repair protein RecF [bacterium]|nr:DNA replication/repair protein RecF [bacterium]
MHVGSIRLSQFRNYGSLEVPFHPRLNLILGMNAQGKTSLLEALYCLSAARSFRAGGDDEMIQFGRESAAVEGLLQKEKGQDRVFLEFRKHKGKTLTLNGKKQKKLSALLGQMPAVVFSPDDLFLVKGGPALRRKYLDLTILQLDGGFLPHYQQYERALKQRNALLRQRPADLDPQLRLWDEPLAEHGAAILARRLKAARELSRWAAQALADLTGGQEKFELRYESALAPGGEGAGKDDIRKAFAKARREEMARGITVVGPHRDDIGLYVNGELLRKFGSQGQQRTAALALKLAQLSLLAEGCHTEPLVLFDDVMSELDEKRQAFFLERLQRGGQAFLTGTAARDFAAAARSARIFTVEGGRVGLTQEGPAA